MKKDMLEVVYKNAMKAMEDLKHLQAMLNDIGSPIGACKAKSYICEDRLKIAVDGMYLLIEGAKHD